MAKIVRFYESGDASVLQIEDVPLQEPNFGEVRIKVSAFALNRSEVYFRENQYIHPLIYYGWKDMWVNWGWSLRDFNIVRLVFVPPGASVFIDLIVDFISSSVSFCLSLVCLGVCWSLWSGMVLCCSCCCWDSSLLLFLFLGRCCWDSSLLLFLFLGHVLDFPHHWFWIRFAIFPGVLSLCLHPVLVFFYQLLSGRFLWCYFL